ncbi:MAG: N-acyl-D-amino-acid deacylase family protein, partial [Gaiellaceae bacterium]
MSDFDLIVRGGRVLDGAGNPWVRADVGMRGDRIAAVGHDLGTAQRVLDVDDLVVSPGFIDMHTHSDLQLLATPLHEAKVRQGVTLEVLGHDGLSYAPVDDRVLGLLRSQLAAWNDDPAGFDWSWRTVGEYLDRLDEGIAVNAAYLIPHGSVRMLVMGEDDRPPTRHELDDMKRLVAEGLTQGGVGLSTGLTYAPAMYATDDELVELCAVMRDTGGFYAPHHRNYGLKAIEAYADSIEIGRRGGVPVHLTHAHLGFECNKGRGPELLSLVDEARSSGVDVTLDTYPYTAGSTYLSAYLPSWLHVGGPRELIARLRDESLRERIRIELEETGSDMLFGIPIDWSVMVISGVKTDANRDLVGLSVAEAAARRRKRTIDLCCELLADEELAVPSIAHIGNEENVRTIMTHPAHMAGSDGILVGELPHPRGYGTFPRYLAEYVRKLGILTLADAVRKMTSLPAQRLGLHDRGLVRPGMAADIVVFDPDGIQDVATYDEPRHHPVGIP